MHPLEGFTPLYYFFCMALCHRKMSFAVNLIQNCTTMKLPSFVMVDCCIILPFPLATIVWSCPFSHEKTILLQLRRHLRFWLLTAWANNCFIVAYCTGIWWRHKKRVYSSKISDKNPRNTSVSKNQRSNHTTTMVLSPKPPHFHSITPLPSASIINVGDVAHRPSKI